MRSENIQRQGGGRPSYRFSIDSTPLRRRIKADGLSRRRGAWRVLAELDGDDSALGCALTDLADSGRSIHLVRGADEYSVLLIGLTRGELVI
jgi:hypothetical protein